MYYGLIEKLANILSTEKLCKQLQEKTEELLELAVSLSKAKQLTREEEIAGETNGKLACVKMYKQRTGKTILESKAIAEQHFKINGLWFWNRALGTEN